jgi:hypothetical protein
MMDCWDPCPEAAARWIGRLQSTILHLGPPRQACFVSIANAIEVQIEDGADPETLRHLLRALHACAQGAGVAKTALGLDENVDTTIARIQPQGPGTR